MGAPLKYKSIQNVSHNECGINLYVSNQWSIFCVGIDLTTIEFYGFCKVVLGIYQIGDSTGKRNSGFLKIKKQ